MFSLRNPILATIAYYDIFNYPLILIEVFQYMINPSRLTKLGGIQAIELSEVLSELDNLCRAGTISQKNGFYFLAGREDIYELRICREKISAQKWKKFLKYSRIISAAPYLQGILASGSMALGNTDKESDFDVLIIAKNGRLYTARFFLWLISSIFGIRRKPYEKIAPDKLCFNHFITDGDMALIHESLFNAQTYVNLKPVLITEEMLDKFFSANIWLNNYIYNFKPQKHFVRRSIVKGRMAKISSKIVEIVLNSSMGEWVEDKLRIYQHNRIKSNPKTYESGGRVVFNNRELEFHPRSFEKTVIIKYREHLRKLGIIPFMEERDSGLNS